MLQRRPGLWGMKRPQRAGGKALVRFISAQYAGLSEPGEAMSHAPPPPPILTDHLILTRGTDYAYHITTWHLPLRIFRPSYGPELCVSWAQCKRKSDIFYLLYTIIDYI